MNDRELLEMSAKAAGIDFYGYDDKYGLYLAWDDPRDPAYWNPLTDDGDALRLAVRLDISIEFTTCQDDAPVVWCRHWDYAQMHANFPDPYSATRRAIVRAAAEIGKAMP